MTNGDTSLAILLCRVGVMSCGAELFTAYDYQSQRLQFALIELIDQVVEMVVGRIFGFAAT